MNIREHLARRRPLLFDGAMGTYYGHPDQRVEQAGIDHPEAIAAIHRAYLQAGCRAIKTNTFSAGVDAAFGDTARAAAYIEAACRLALAEAAPFDAAVFADLGPAPLQTRRTPAETWQVQMELFLQQGVTNFLLETLPGEDGVAEAAAWLKQRCPDAFLLVSFAVDASGSTRLGQNGKDLLLRTAALDVVDAVGFNCMSGPGALLALTQSLPPLDKPLSVMPNAGYPAVLGRRTVYQGKPEYFAQKLAALVQAGAAMVGGCCGTTPAHLAAAAALLPEFLPEQAAPQPPAASRPAPRPNPLWEALESGRRVVAVELDPPGDDNLAPFVEGVQALHAAGADAITIADCPIGRPRADSSLLACKIHRELGVEPLPHMTCR